MFFLIFNMLMNTFKQLLLLVLISCSYYASAQSLTPTVVSSGGTYATSGIGSLSYTVGEMAAVSTLMGGLKLLTQGFQQSDRNEVLEILESEESGLESLVLYPNPAKGAFTIGYKFPASGYVSINMYDAIGKLVAPVLEEQYQDGNALNSFDCSNIAIGTYLIQLDYAPTSGQKPLSIQKKLIITQ